MTFMYDRCRYSWPAVTPVEYADFPHVRNYLRVKIRLNKVRHPAGWSGWTYNRTKICDNGRNMFKGCFIMMTSSNGNTFLLLAFCAGISPVTCEFPSQRPVTRSFGVFFDLAWTNGWVNNRDAGDLRRHRTHYEVTVMIIIFNMIPNVSSLFSYIV